MRRTKDRPNALAVSGSGLLLQCCMLTPLPQLHAFPKRHHSSSNPCGPSHSVPLQAATAPGLLEIFQKCNETLEQVQKNLEDYLETKRVSFPR